jgi:hypothetical protein
MNKRIRAKLLPPSPRANQPKRKGRQKVTEQDQPRPLAPLKLAYVGRVLDCLAGMRAGLTPSELRQVHSRFVVESAIQYRLRGQI